MPCFDKKLEASREQLKVRDTEIRETDCVVSTAELLEEIQKMEEDSEDVEKRREEEEEWMNALGKGKEISKTACALYRTRLVLCVDELIYQFSHFPLFYRVFHSKIHKTRKKRFFVAFSVKIHIKSA